MTKTGVVEWAVRSRTLPGESICGDRCLVMEVWEGVLVAVIDGIGHGVEAAKASEAAVKSIEANAATRSFSSLLQQCHMDLQKTRGVVLSLAFLDSQRTMTWMGIGNVEGRLIRRRAQYAVKYAEKSESLLLRTGVIGGETEQLPAFYPRGVALIRGDFLVMATDGIKGDFESFIDLEAAPKAIAENLITTRSRNNDDALVFVGRYIG